MIKNWGNKLLHILLYCILNFHAYCILNFYQMSTDATIHWKSKLSLKKGCTQSITVEKHVKAWKKQCKVRESRGKSGKVGESRDF